MTQLAVIKTGGKQYLVSPGQKIKIEKIEVKPASAKASAGEEGQEIVFDEVLLVAYSPSGSAGPREKSKKVEIGTPFVKNAKVIGKILSQGKSKKVIVFKYKPKTRYKKKGGHRQPFTEIEILTINYKP